MSPWKMSHNPLVALLVSASQTPETGSQWTEIGPLSPLALKLPSVKPSRALAFLAPRTQGGVAGNVSKCCVLRLIKDSDIFDPAFWDQPWGLARMVAHAD